MINASKQYASKLFSHSCITPVCLPYPFRMICAVLLCFNILMLASLAYIRFTQSLLSEGL